MQVKTMKRFLLLILCTTLLITVFSGCSNTPTDVRILNTHNSAAVALAHMLEPDENAKNNYISTVVNLPSRAQTLFINDECDVAVAPCETATALYHSKNPEIKILAGISVGGFELASTKSIKDFSELKNQTIYVTERGTLMEHILKYAASLYNVNPFEEIKIEFASDNIELEQMLKDNEATFALLSSAQASMLKANNLNLTTYNLTDVLSKKLKKPSIINYCVVATNKFIKENAKAVEVLIKDIESSINNSSDVSKTLSLAKKHGLITDDFFDEDFLTSCKIDFISGEEMKKKSMAYYELLGKIKAFSTGSSKLKDDFYYVIEK